MRFHFHSIACSSFLALFMATASPVKAEVSDDDTQKLLKAIEKQGKRIENEEHAIAVHQQKVASERAEFEALKAKVEALTGKKSSAGSKAPVAIANTRNRPMVAAVPVDASGVPAEVGTDRKQAPPEKPPEVAKYIEEGGVLMPKGKVEIAPSLEYDRTSATTVAIEGFSIIPALNIGLFDISQVNRDVLMGAVQGRVGVTDRIEVEAKVPYLYGSQSTTGRAVGVGASADTVSNIGGEGLGDIEFGAHYQINRGLNGWPYFVANLRYKTDTGDGPFDHPASGFGLETRVPTGSGFNAVQPSVTMIYPSDPVVFYSNVGYVHNFSQSFASYGDIQPGDSVNASFGMSLALNDAASISLGYSHAMVFKTKINNEIVPGAYNLQVGSLDVGYAYTINDWISLNLNVSAGVTSDAPDDRVILRVPMTFDLF